MKLPAGMLAGLDAAFNRYLRLDPESMDRMTQLDVSCIALEFRGLELTLYITPDADGVSIRDHFDGIPDATISGTPLGLTQLGLGSRKERALFSGDVEITGNVESGQAFQAVLEGMDIDWEEQLSHVTGDIVAHHAGNAVRHAAAFLKKGGESARRNTTEYLQEELRILPARIEIENFCSDVTQLSMDVDRLAMRVERLRKRLASSEQA